MNTSRGAPDGDSQIYSLLPWLRPTNPDVERAGGRRCGTAPVGYAIDHFPDFGEAADLIRKMPGRLRSPFELALVRVAGIAPKVRRARIQAALKGVPEAAADWDGSIQRVAKYLPPYQPRFASVLTNAESAGLRLVPYRPVGVRPNTVAGLEFLPEFAENDLEVGPEVRQMMNDGQLFTFLFFLAVYACDSALPDVPVPPAVILAAFAAGMGHMNEVVSLSNSDWANYGPARFEQRGWGLRIHDFLICMDVIYENLDLLRGFEFDNYGMGRDLVDAFNGRGSFTFRPSFRFESSNPNNLFGEQRGNLTILYDQCWVQGRRPSSSMAGPIINASGIVNEPARGDCAPWELREVITTLVHEQVHRVFNRRGLISGAGDWCNGSSWWSTTPTGNHHYFCEWAGVTFTDTVWQPAQYNAADSVRNQDDLNRLTMRHTDAFWCACPTTPPNQYQGGVPASVVWDWSCNRQP